MTNEELVSLIQQGENVSENMGILYQQNIRFIQSIVKRYNFIVDNDDLMQEAYFALQETVEKCDLSHEYIECPFLALFKKVLIHRSIRYIDKNRSCLSLHSMGTTIRKYEQLKSKYNKLPDAELVMQELNLSKRQYDSLMEAIRINDSISIDNPVKAESGEDLCFEDIISSGEDVEEIVVEADSEEYLKTVLWNQVDLLDDCKKAIINLSYKVNLTKEDIAMNLGFSISNIKKLKREALEQLRKMKKIQELGEQYGYDCSLAYKTGMQAWKNGRGSSVERLAMKHLEYEEQFEHEKEKLLNVLKEGDFDKT